MQPETWNFTSMVPAAKGFLHVQNLASHTAWKCTRWEMRYSVQTNRNKSVTASWDFHFVASNQALGCSQTLTGFPFIVDQRKDTYSSKIKS